MLMITTGHIYAWEYDWDDYTAAIDAVQELRQQLRKELAMAVCDGVNLAFSDKTEIQKYLKESPKKHGDT